MAVTSSGSRSTSPCRVSRVADLGRSEVVEHDRVALGVDLLEQGLHRAARSAVPHPAQHHEQQRDPIERPGDEPGQERARRCPHGARRRRSGRHRPTRPTRPARSVTATNRANRSGSTDGDPTSPSSSAAASGAPRSVSTGCHGHRGGAPPPPSTGPSATAWPRRRARRATSSASAVFPMPAGPCTVTRAPRPAATCAEPAVEPTELRRRGRRSP